MEFLNVDVQVAQVQKALEGTALSIPSIRRKTMTSIAKNITQVENKAFNSADFRHGVTKLAHKYDYNLRSIFKYHYTKAGDVNIFPKRYQQGRGNDIIIPVVVSLNYGRTYTVRKKLHTIKPRRFIDVANVYAQNSTFNDIIQKTIDGELKKYWG